MIKYTLSAISNGKWKNDTNREFDASRKIYKERQRERGKEKQRELEKREIEKYIKRERIREIEI